MQPRDLLLPALVCAWTPACGDAGGGTSSSSSSSSSTGDSSSGDLPTDPTGSATSRADTGGTGTGDLDDTGSSSGATPTSTSPSTTTTGAEAGGTTAGGSDGQTSTATGGATTTDDSSGGETASACGDEFTDPHGDGSLRLSGDEVFVLGPGPYDFSWICVQDSAHLLVCDETTIFLGNDKISVIEGQGIGALGPGPALVNLHLEPDPAEAFIYFDAEVAHLTLLLFAVGADLTYAVHGMAGVLIDGQNMQNNATYQAGEPMFPACP